MMASRSGLWLCATFCLFLGTLADASTEDSPDVNAKKDMGSKQPFRMNKINLIWEKAQKNLDEGQLVDLYAELTIQDRLEVETKRKTAEGFDQDGSHQAITRNRLIDILTRFGLRRLHEDEIDNRVDLDVPGKFNDVDFRQLDQRLGKLMHKAQLSGFTDGQLADLKQELLHHQEKLDEFDGLRNDINNLGDLHDNSLDGFKQESFDRKDTIQKKQDLKRRHQELKEDYLFLERMSDGYRDALEFTDPKVIELWVLAKKGNFSEVEMESLKEELRHFEHKLKKHEKFKEEAELAGANLLSFGKVNDPMARDKVAKLDEKVTDYQRKLKKVHTELKHRIAKNIRHSEL